MLHVPSSPEPSELGQCPQIPRIQRYYHLTESSRLESVLSDGLRPGVELGIENTYNGELCDNRYVYLAKNSAVFFNPHASFRIPCPEDKVLLAVDLPIRHPLERDLDVALMFNGSIMGLIEFQRVVVGLLGVTDLSNVRAFLTEENGTLYDELMVAVEKGDKEALSGLFMILASDPGAVRQFLLRASDERWDEHIGFYRTTLRIPIECLSQFNPKNLTFSPLHGAACL